MALPALQPSAYGWAQESARVWRRRALAGEQMWIARRQEYHQMYLGGSFLLPPRVYRNSFVSAARDAWCALRFAVPELVLAPSYDSAEAGVGYFRYQVPGEREVAEWLDYSLLVSEADEPGFYALRNEVTAKKGDPDTYQAFMLLHLGKGDEIRDVHFMLNVHHLIADGIGVRILLGRYLSLLTQHLHRSATRYLVWEESVKNLSAPWIGLMNEQQRISGEEYEKTVAWNQEVLQEKMPRNCGLPIKASSSAARPSSSQKHHSITFSREESQSLLSAIKTHVGPESNITHLGHAAVVLALVRATTFKPSTSPTQLGVSDVLYSPCWLNGRRYLLHAPAPYIPICQSFAPVVFPDLAALVTSRHASAAEVKERLVEACRVATAEYGKIRLRASVLPESVAVLEGFGRQMIRKTQEEKQDRTEGSDIDVRPSKADPFFLSDGITEQYISRSYSYPTTDPASTSISGLEDDSTIAGSTAPITLTLNPDLRFAANAEGPNLIIRLSSWCDEMSLSAEWREMDYDDGQVLDFLEDVKGVMMLLLLLE